VEVIGQPQPLCFEEETCGAFELDSVEEKGFFPCRGSNPSPHCSLVTVQTESAVTVKWFAPVLRI
jgi:hypothetical protein